MLPRSQLVRYYWSQGEGAGMAEVEGWGLHREIKTQILGKPNSETKAKKNNFGAHFETYSKTRFVAS